jgi:hypothetical protein
VNFVEISSAWRSGADPVLKLKIDSGPGSRELKSFVSKAGWEDIVSNFANCDLSERLWGVLFGELLLRPLLVASILLLWPIYLSCVETVSGFLRTPS